MLTLRKIGVPIEVHHHEVATAGQCEIDIRYGSLLKMADNLMYYKYVIKNTARKYNMTATFMPKPLFKDNGSGMHVHQSLWKDGKNTFFDKDGYALLSKNAMYYIGGLLKHSHAILAFGAPTTNSYKRWSRDMKLRSTWCIPSVTVPRRCVFRCILKAPKQRGSSSVRLILPPTRIWYLPRCSWPD